MYYKLYQAKYQRKESFIMSKDTPQFRNSRKNKCSSRQNGNEAISDTPQEITLQGTVQLFGVKKQLFKVQDVINHCRKQISSQYWEQQLGSHIFNLIDWDIFQQISYNQRHYCSIIKMISGLTPTKQRLTKIQQDTSPLCPLCKQEEEDIRLVLICPKNSEHIQNSKEDIARKMKSYGDTRQIVMTVIESIIQNKSMNHQEYTNAQEELGWQRFIQGKIAIAMEDSVKPFMKKPNTAKQFILKPCIEVVKTWRKSWLKRLRMVVDSTNNENKNIQHENNTRKLEYLYKNRQLLGKDNQRFLFQDITYHLEQIQKQIEAWISLHYNSMKQSIIKRNSTRDESDSQIRPLQVLCEAD